MKKSLGKEGAKECGQKILGGKEEKEWGVCERNNDRGMHKIVMYTEKSRKVTKTLK